MTNLKERFKNIKLLIFDLQGVLISNQSNHSEKELGKFHDVMKNFCDFAHRSNLAVSIITGLTNEQLYKNISNKYTYDMLSGSFDKVSQADKLIEKHSITYDNVFYMGDGLFDIPLLKKAALSAAPEDARREVKKVVDFICAGINAEERLNFIKNLII